MFLLCDWAEKKQRFFWHQSEARIAPTVWNWSVKTLSPGALIFLLDFSSPEFFSRPLDFSPPPLTAPGSPRMNDTQFKDVLNYVALVAKYLIFCCFQDNTAVTFDRFTPFLSNKIDTLRQIALKNKQLKEFNKKWKNFI